MASIKALTSEKIADFFAFVESRVSAFPDIIERKDTNSTFTFLLNYFRTMWPYIIIGSFLTVAISGIELLVFHFLSELINWLTSNKNPEARNDSMTPFLPLIFIYSTLPFLNLAQNLFNYQILAETLPIRFSYLAHQVTLKRNIAFFSNNISAEISAKISQTANAIKDVSTSIIDAFLYLAVFFSGVVYAVFSSDWIFFAPIVVWLIFYTLIISYFIDKIDIASQKYAGSRSKQSGILADIYSNIRAIKVFSNLDSEKKAIQGPMSETLRRGRYQYRYITFFSSSLYALNTLLLFAVCFLSWRSWQNGGLTVGGVAAAIALVLRVNSFSHWMMWETANFLSNFGTIKDGFRFLIPNGNNLTKNDARRTLEPSADAISFRNVVFRYPGSNKPIFNGLTIDIAAGEKVGIVGKSGSGKSTLLAVLLGFYEIESGCVSIGSNYINDLNETMLRANVSIAAQDSMLLGRSLIDNLLPTRHTADKLKFHSIVSATGVDVVKERLHDQNYQNGWYAFLSETAQNLSGGQKQRIAMARALLKESPIIVFDEATSALDSESESNLINNIQKFLKDKTVLSVAHRLSSLSHVDRIIVLEDGHVVENGSHDKLIETDGVYSEFWRKQTMSD